MRIVLPFLAVLALPAWAEPITDDSRRCFLARWEATRATDCDQVCRDIRHRAEQIALSGADGAQPVFLCRHRRGPEWSFGTQSSGNCRAATGGEVFKRTSYECLCAREVRC